MQCFNPINIRSPNYSGPVACGQCFACQSNRRRDFAFRLKEEMKHSVCSYTLTLSYDDLHIPPLESFSDDPLNSVLTPAEECDIHKFYYHPYDIRDIQLFHKKLRKHFKLRYFGVAEYGSHSNRPHYHIIYFFKSPVDYNEFLSKVCTSWGKGSRITLDVTDDSCIQYTLKYCLKPRWIKQPSPKVFASKNPFIGSGFLSGSMLQYLERNRTGDFIKFPDYQKRLPRILRDYLYSGCEAYLDENSAYIDDQVAKQEEHELEEASERGISLDELRRLKREYFTETILKSIKKKQL